MGSPICYTNDGGGWSTRGCYASSEFCIGLLPTKSFTCDSVDVWLANLSSPPGTVHARLCSVDASYVPTGDLCGNVSTSPAWGAVDVPVKASWSMPSVALASGTKYGLVIGTAGMGVPWFPAHYYSIRKGTGGVGIPNSNAQHMRDTSPPMAPTSWGAWYVNATDTWYASINGVVKGGKSFIMVSRAVPPGAVII